MITRNWLSLSRKLVDRTDLNFSFTAVQEAVGEYALAWFGEGVVNTSQYPNPFPITRSGSVLGGTVGYGIGFDRNGQLTNITPSTLDSPNFTLSASNPTNPRFDLLCIAYKSVGDTLIPKPSDPLVSIFLNLHDDFQLVVVPGTPSATPVYPAKGNGLYIVLAGIQIPANATLGTQCTIDYSVREQANSNTAQFPVLQQEVPTGVVNGTNQSFTLSQLPINGTSTILFLDGVEQTLGSAWSIINQAITLSVAPRLGQQVEVWYIVQSSSSQNPLSGAQEVPTVAPNGVLTSFPLIGKPANQISTMVFVDGALVPVAGWNLIQGSSNGTIQFNSEYIPSTGQSIDVFYLVNAFAFGTQPPSSYLTGAVNLGSGKDVLAGVVGGVAQFKSLVQGSNITLTEDANTITITSSGGGGGSGALSVQGSIGSPQVITAAGGITSTTDQRQLWFVRSSGGIVTITANPQISAGVTIGQELLIQGVSATNYIIFSNGNGLSLNGPVDLTDNGAINLIWNGVVWTEQNRR